MNNLRVAWFALFMYMFEVDNTRAIFFVPTASIIIQKPQQILLTMPIQKIRLICRVCLPIGGK